MFSGQPRIFFDPMNKDEKEKKKDARDRTTIDEPTESEEVEEIGVEEIAANAGGGGGDIDDGLLGVAVTPPKRQVFFGSRAQERAEKMRA